jgi:hypothetical protein
VLSLIGSVPSSTAQRKVSNWGQTRTQPMEAAVSTSSVAANFPCQIGLAENRATPAASSRAASSHEPVPALPAVDMTSLMAPAPQDAQVANWRQKRKIKDAVLRPRDIAADEDDPSLTPAQRTMARLRRRAAEREAQSQQ